MKRLEELKENPNLRVLQTTFDGGNGEVKIGGWKGTVIWSFGGRWEHVSVAPYRTYVTPSWDDMCKLKEMFFKDEECVLQYHPPKSDYINIMQNCLHLWRPTREAVPMPPVYMV